MEFNELIRQRFSCRALSDREIPHDVLGRIFEAARLAPTAVNKQPFKVWAVESPEGRAKLAETTKFTFSAGVFLVTSATSPMWMPPSLRRTSCSPSTTRDSARRGSDTSMQQS